MQKSESLEAKAEYEEICSFLNPGALIGLTVLVELGTIFSVLRPFEVRKSNFVSCDRKGHVISGFTSGIKCSMNDLGCHVRRLQMDAEREIRESVLFSEPLLPDWIDRIRKLRDDVDNRNAGYWALVEPSNQNFLEDTIQWCKRLAHRHETKLMTKGWVESAYRVLAIILASAHLGGGGPARGTELGSYMLRNRVNGVRSGFFVGEEVMLVPEYDKRRALLQGTVRFISRHLDPVTSMLLKMFLVLVRPILLSFVKSRAMEKGNWNGEYRFRVWNGLVMAR